MKVVILSKLVRDLLFFVVCMLFVCLVVALCWLFVICLFGCLFVCFFLFGCCFFCLLVVCLLFVCLVLPPTPTTPIVRIPLIRVSTCDPPTPIASRGLHDHSTTRGRVPGVALFHVFSETVGSLEIHINATGIHGGIVAS